MGRAGSCFDNAAAAESFFSTLEWEIYRLTPFALDPAVITIVVIAFRDGTYRRRERQVVPDQIGPGIGSAWVPPWGNRSARRDARVDVDGARLANGRW